MDSGLLDEILQRCPALRVLVMNNRGVMSDAEFHTMIKCCPELEMAWLMDVTVWNDPAVRLLHLLADSMQQRGAETKNIYLNAEAFYYLAPLHYPECFTYVSVDEADAVFRKFTLNNRDMRKRIGLDF